jgi:AcrR family transcriptional regulator
MTMTRRYTSALRDEKASRTREALLQACEALLLEGPIEQVTIPAIAQRAGVTKPTAYKYFPDQDALLAGFLGHVRERIGMTLETLTRIPPEELPAAVRANYRRFDRNAELLRRMMDSPSYERVRLAHKVDRAALALPLWRDAADEATLRRRLAPIYLLLSPPSWRWLRDTWGLSGEDASAAAAWAMETLVSALNTGARAKVPTESRKSRTNERRKGNEP